MKRVGQIDSLNLSHYSFEQLFNNEDYIIVTVKSIGIFEPKLWLDTFGKSLTKNIIEAKIIYTNTGLAIPLKRYSINPKMQTIEFAGMYRYDEKSKLLRELLRELLSKFNDCFISRIDICFDYERVPSKIVKKVSEARKKIFPYKNTSYFKTEKEKKTNQRIDIKLYNKQLKDKLDKYLMRLEFVFKGTYFNHNRLTDFNKLISKKIEKSIKKFAGIDCVISL